MTELHPFRLLVIYLSPQGRRVACLSVVLLLGIGLQLLGPLLLRQIIDAAVSRPDAPLTYFWVLALAFVATNLAIQVMQVGATWLSEEVGGEATNHLRADLTRHILRLDLSFFTQRSPGELIERLDGDVRALSDYFAQFVVQVVGGGLLLIGILIALSLHHVWLGCAMSAFAAVAILALYLARTRAVGGWMSYAEARSALSSFLEERIGGLDDIRANAGGHHVMGRMTRLTAHLSAVGVRAGVQGAQIWISGMLIFSICISVGLAFGVWQYQRGQASVGSVYLLVQYGLLLAGPLTRIGAQLQLFQQAASSLARVNELQAHAATIREGAGVEWPRRALSVEFNDVSFAYHSNTPVLSGVSLRVEPGEIIGFLGRTGAGKTTMIRLLRRLYDPTAGRILIEGCDIGDATFVQLQSNVGVVTQDVQLFRATVRDNVTLFDPTIDDRRILQALQELGLGQWFGRLPQGLDTLISGTAGLSAGEAQLLALARVFLQDPGVLVLDEPSSRIDPATDWQIERALDKLLSPTGSGARRRTTLLIAHKLSTVRRADRIVILERGRIVEMGERARLEVDPRSQFAQLLRAGHQQVLT